MKKTVLELRLTHMTVNPEGAEEGNGDIGSSIRFDGDVLVDKLVPMYSTSKSFSSWIGAMWDEKTGDLLGVEFGAIPMKTNLEKVDAIISGPVSEDKFFEFQKCKLNSVILTPKDSRRVGLTLKLYVHPDDGEWNKMTEHLRREVVLTLTGGKEIEKREPKPKNHSLPLGNPEGDKPASNGSSLATEEPGAAPVH